MSMSIGTSTSTGRRLIAPVTAPTGQVTAAAIVRAAAGITAEAIAVADMAAGIGAAAAIAADRRGVDRSRGDSVS